MDRLSGLLGVLPLIPIAAVFFLWLWDEHKRDKARYKKWKDEDDAL